jgi:hypothetical protein
LVEVREKEIPVNPLKKVSEDVMHASNMMDKRRKIPNNILKNLIYEN